LLGYNVAKASASPRNSTWFTRPFLLVRGWGLGTRLSNPLPYPISPPPIPRDLVAKQLPKGRGISQRNPPSVPPMLLVWHFIYILCLALYTDSSAWFHLSGLNFMVTICTASSLIWRLFLRVNKNQIVTENWVRLGKVTMTHRPKLQDGTCMHMLQCNYDCERSFPLILCVCTCKAEPPTDHLKETEKRWLPAASDPPIHLTLSSSTRSKKPFGKYISIVPLPWAEESLGTRLYVYYHLPLSLFSFLVYTPPHLYPLIPPAAMHGDGRPILPVQPAPQTQLHQPVQLCQQLFHEQCGPVFQQHEGAVRLRESPKDATWQTSTHPILWLRGGARKVSQGSFGNLGQQNTRTCTVEPA